MLLTTCTTCAAQFKVLPEHLNVRQGRVMCGRCRTVFNAFETLKRVEDELPVMPTPYFPTSVPVSAANSSAAPSGSSAYAQTMSPIGVAPSYSVSGGEVNAPLTNTGLRDDSTGRFTPLLDTMLGEDFPADTAEDRRQEHAEAFPVPHATLPPDRAHSAASGFNLADEIDAVKETTETTETTANSNAPIDAKLSRREPTMLPRDLRQLSSELPPAALRDSRVESQLESALEAPLEFNADPLSGPPLMATDPADADEPLTYPREQVAPPSRRWLILSGAMVLVLGAQSVFYFRHSLSQSYPQLRPALASTCEMLGCRLSWARESAAIEVKGSELVELPSKPGRMLASATLINRGKVTQEYPAIELRLTNNTNQTVMSRVLLPSDYLSTVTVKDQGMMPNAEVALSLNIEVPPKTAASGYEFLPFYP